ncbi:DNA repair and recombination protein RAD52 [Scheffersomyces coipomensis]|uniref:DNA repair and recombination protein RAD52 n=1 Tax=Scheffersomyces coipomensis TaxID=1788519 RepID=UPI00315CC4F3
MPQRDNRFRPNPSAPVRQFQKQSYTQEEQTRIQGILDKVLGPEYVSFRPGGGGTNVSYIEGWRALNLANEVFGFNGWNSELVSQQVDFLDTHGNSGRYSMGLSVVIRVTIKDGTYHEDFGYGYIENAKSKAMAFEKCRKEAFTDGIKRCLRCFGSLLGNCLYDKTIIKQMQNIEKIKTTFETSDFHRDPMFMERHKNRDIPSTHLLEKPVQQNNPIQNGSNGAAPRVISAPNQANNRQPPPSIPVQNTAVSTPINSNQYANNNVNTTATKKQSNVYHPSTQEAQDLEDSFLFSDDIGEEDLVFVGDQNDKSNSAEKDANTTANSINQSNQSINKTNAITPNVPKVGMEFPLFVSARGADLLQQTPENASNIPQFNHKFVSPNMRRTIDPTKSAPVKRAEVNNAPTATISRNSQPTTSALNPISNESGNSLGKRIGMPPIQRPPSKRLHKE